MSAEVIPSVMNNAADVIPEGWAYATTGQIVELNPPKPCPGEFADDLPVTFVPMPAVSAESGAITAPEERPLCEVRKGYTAFRDGDVLFAKITPCMENGKAAIAEHLINGLGFGSTEFHVLRPTGAVIPEYVYYFVRQESFRRDAEAEMTGSVGQKRVPLGFIETSGIPLPPLAEQKRIVAKVEELLARVNAGRERLDRVPKIMKRFRQAVLDAACSGKLTEDWRAQDGEAAPVEFGVSSEDLPDSWRESSLSSVVRVTSGEAFKKSEYSPSGVKLLQIANVSFGEVIWEQENFLPPSYLKSHAKLVLNEGDIVMALNRPLLNWRMKVARLTRGDTPAILYQRVGRFSFISSKRSINPDFLFLFLQSFGFIHELSERLRGTDQPYVNPPEMLEILFPVPPLPEQREIVRRVETLFKLADAIEKRVAAAKLRADKLTQSILAKAFQGDLVPTEAELARREGRSYEPASVLLERIRAEREREKPKTKKTRTRR